MTSETNPLDEEEFIIDFNEPTKKKPWKTIIISVILLILATGGYLGWKYIDGQKIVEPTPALTGRTAVTLWETALKTGEPQSIIEDGYLTKEFALANENPDREAFIKKVLATVHYEIPQVQARKKNGSPAFEDDGKTAIMVTDPLIENRAVTLEIVDWKALKPVLSELETLPGFEGLTPDMPDYEVRVTDLFTQWVVSQDVLPTKKVKHEVDLVEVEVKLDNETGRGFAVGETEDEFLDETLFSSEQFFDLQERFSLTLKGLESPPKNPAYESWQGLSDEDRKAQKEPAEFLVVNDFDSVFVGAKFLESASKDDLLVAPEGDGSFDRPASFNTPVFTVNNSTQKAPIKVDFKWIRTGKEAVSFLENLDIANRGIYLDSSIKVMVAEVEVTNAGKETISVDANLGLVDQGGNFYARTGQVYGLVESLSLAPGESGRVQTWFNSVSLDSLFLVWGADFPIKEDFVWFHCLGFDKDETQDDEKEKQNNT